MTLKPIIGITPESITLKHRWDGRGAFCGVSYSEAIKRAGGIPLILPLTDDTGQLDYFLTQCDGWVIAGGADVHGTFYGLPKNQWSKVKGADPVRDRMEIYLLKRLVERDVPILAICRGIQVLNVAFGGTLRPHLRGHRNPQPDALAHALKWKRGARTLRWMGGACPRVNTSHHQAVERVAPGFEVVAHAPDGIIEAMEKPDARFCCAVQFHPERLIKKSVACRQLFRALVRAAGQR